MSGVADAACTYLWQWPRAVLKTHGPTPRQSLVVPAAADDMVLPYSHFWVAKPLSGGTSYPANVFNTIQDAVNAASAIYPVRATVFLCGGVWTDPIVLPVALNMSIAGLGSRLDNTVHADINWSPSHATPGTLGLANFTSLDQILLNLDDFSGFSGIYQVDLDNIAAYNVFIDGVGTVNQTWRAKDCVFNYFQLGGDTGLMTGSQVTVEFRPGNDAIAQVEASVIAKVAALPGATSSYTQHSGSVGDVDLSLGAAGIVADLRGIGAHGTLTPVAGGGINRSSLRMTTGALAAGAATVAFSVPFLDANYEVDLVQTAGAATTVPVRGTKSSTGFAITVPSGGATYDVLVVHD